MEIQDRELILKYLHITLLSYSRICHFTPVEDEENRVKVRLREITDDEVKMRVDRLPSGLDGYLAFYAYTFIFRFQTQLTPGSEPGIYHFPIPEKIETFDRRKHARLKFDSSENLIVDIYNKTSDNYFQALLKDISAGGIGISVIDRQYTPRKEDVIVTEMTLKDKSYVFKANVAQTRGEFVGCTFMDRSEQEEEELNQVVEAEIKQRSDEMLETLKKREDMIRSVYKTEDNENAGPNDWPEELLNLEKMDLFQPISYSTIKVFSDLLGLEIREKSFSNRDRLLPRFEISILLDIFFDDILGKVILNMSKKLALKIFEILLEEEVDEFNEEVKDAVAEVCNMITGNAKSEFEKQGLYYKLSTPLVLKSRENVIVYARNMNFLSSVYWTSEGFFDLSFSFTRK